MNALRRFKLAPLYLLGTLGMVVVVIRGGAFLYFNLAVFALGCALEFAWPRYRGWADDRVVREIKRNQRARKGAA
jgi:hypothetical protein